MTEEIKNDTPKEEVKYNKGIILYSDGGSRDNYGGWGVHGYLYTEEPSSKGSGNQQYKLTNKGYYNNQTFKSLDDNSIIEVKPELYFDGFGSFSQPATNNLAELVAATNALTIPIYQDVNKVTLFTDSKYVVVGANEWLHKWKANGFLKTDGTLITNKNEWLMLDEQINKVKEKNIDLNIEWVKGHNGDLGNDTADKLATIGVMHSKANLLKSEVDTSPSTGYWTNKSDKHPFLSIKKCYFITDPTLNEPGKYFLGDNGKDHDLEGKRGTDNSICYVELDEVDYLIESVKKKQMELCNQENIITLINLDLLFNSQVADGLKKYGPLFLVRHNNRNYNLAPITSNKNDKPDTNIVTRGLVPPKIAIRVIDNISELKGVFDAWKNKDSNLIQTNITECFYDKDKKGNDKLKSSLSNGINHIKTNISYGQEGNISKYELELYFGNDIPDRNTFKKIESLHPEVTLITWMESDKCFKYATVIKIDNGVGIWSSASSNFKFV